MKTLLLLALAFAPSAWGAYPSAKVNENLREEIEGDPNRLLPAGDWYTFALDGTAWERNLGLRDFYHGVGYWLQGRSEIRPSPHFRLNVRTILYSGSSSQGYAEPTGFYNLIGITGYLPEIYGWQTSARIVDLGQQTIGAGLLVQDRETNGLLLKLGKDWFEARVLTDSTGALLSRDDMVSPEMRLFDGWIGAGAAFWTASKEQSQLPYNRAFYHYLYSNQWITKHIGIAAELGRREKSNSGMLAVRADKREGRFRYNAQLEYRKYGRRFGKDFVRQIEHQYMSYDQYDKPYTSPMNVFVRGDDAQVFAAHANAFFDITHHWRIETLNEVGSFRYRTGPSDNYYFFRAGFGYCPLKGRDDCVFVFKSNKVLTESYTRPHSQVSQVNTPMFKRSTYIGIDAQFRF